MGLRFYQFIDYDASYGNGGTLCYRVEPCVQMLAIQDYCGSSCCRNGAEGDAAFAWAARSHNYASDNGPGPWVVANLTEFDDAGDTNFGPGEFDVYPCPLKPSARDYNNRRVRLPHADNTEILAQWSSPGFRCNPASCTSAPRYPSERFGCYRCDEFARLAYVSPAVTERVAHHLNLEVYDTRQRWETDAFAACFYLATIWVHIPSLPQLISMPCPPPSLPPPYTPPPLPITPPPSPEPGTRPLPIRPLTPPPPTPPPSQPLPQALTPPLKPPLLLAPPPPSSPLLPQAAPPSFPGPLSPMNGRYVSSVATVLYVHLVIAGEVERFSGERRLAFLNRLRAYLHCDPPPDPEATLACIMALDATVPGSVLVEVSVTLPHLWRRYWNGSFLLTEQQQAIRRAVEQLTRLTTDQASVELAIEVEVAPSLLRTETVPALVLLPLQRPAPLIPPPQHPPSDRLRAPTTPASAPVPGGAHGDSQEGVTKTTNHMVMAFAIAAGTPVVCAIALLLAWCRWARRPLLARSLQHGPTALQTPSAIAATHERAAVSEWPSLPSTCAMPSPCALPSRSSSAPVAALRIACAIQAPYIHSRILITSALRVCACHLAVCVCHPGY